MPAMLWLDAPTVAREGYDAVMNGDPVVVNGRIYRILVWLTGVAARALVVADFRRRGTAVPQDLNVGDPTVYGVRPLGVVLSQGSDPVWNHCVKDLRYALRWMVKSPAFSPVAILSLGLGVGVNTAMFSLVDSLLFRPLARHDRPRRWSTSSRPAATATSTPHRRMPTTRT